MITLSVDENNPITQNFYDELIHNLQFHQLECPCGHFGGFTIHGYYQRFLKTPKGKIRLRICRVKCESCGHTHAILLSSMVPYSQISLPDHCSIVKNFENNVSQEPVMAKNPYIDECNCRKIIRDYQKYWRERLKSESIALEPIKKLVQECFAHFSKQFMQIKNTSNILFFNTT